ncbi:Kelch repeat-containing protein [Flammeovirga pacifica]|uniref:Galactose oxidase n=1 Tax=Flammeovirga pacifica TaxID=915059 RepID=A0A1S1YZC2_FLAPC|nr:kelch repeat-containing protein [Flammeovirga pacifica]OHX66348.1 hypothetical protein NH26_08285 [Flammeovirga pacifica]
MKKGNPSWVIFISLLLFISSFLCAQDINQLKQYNWNIKETINKPIGRHESTFVLHQNKFYLMGGRETKKVEVYNPKTNTWITKGEAPQIIHHFQAVSYEDKIYVVGAMTGNYPTELPLENVWIYDPQKDQWEKGPSIPKDIQRGGAGTVVYNKKIYVACGITYGHTSGTTNRFDVFDPKTGQWENLTFAPHIRDHFNAVIAEDKLYLIGGRNSSCHHEGNFTAFFDDVETHVDVYDFKKKSWSTLKNKLPHGSAAAGCTTIGDYIIYLGGENHKPKALNYTQALNIKTHQWSLLSNLVRGRHGSNAIHFKNKIYIAGGSPNQGGGQLDNMEVFENTPN